MNNNTQYEYKELCFLYAFYFQGVMVNEVLNENIFSCSQEIKDRLKSYVINIGRGSDRKKQKQLRKLKIAFK